MTLYGFMANSFYLLAGVVCFSLACSILYGLASSAVRTLRQKNRHIEKK